MNRFTEEEKEREEAPLPRFMQRQYGKVASALEPSHDVMSDERKAIIRFALDYEIRDIRTYAGYRGDLLVEITSAQLAVIGRIEREAKRLGMDTVVKERPDVGIHELYCITPDEEVYGLKEPL